MDFEGDFVVFFARRGVGHDVVHERPAAPPRPLNAREAVPSGSPAVLREREAERGFYADQTSTVYWPSASHRYRRQEGTGPPPSRSSPSWRWLVTASDHPRGGGVEIEDLPEAIGVPSKRIVAQDGGDVDGVTRGPW